MTEPVSKLVLPFKPLHKPPQRALPRGGITRGGYSGARPATRPSALPPIPRALPPRARGRVSPIIRVPRPVTVLPVTRGRGMALSVRGKNIPFPGTINILPHSIIGIVPQCIPVGIKNSQRNVVADGRINYTGQDLTDVVLKGNLDDIKRALVAGAPVDKAGKLNAI